MKQEYFVIPLSERVFFLRRFGRLRYVVLLALFQFLEFFLIARQLWWCDIAFREQSDVSCVFFQASSVLFSASFYLLLV